MFNETYSMIPGGSVRRIRTPHAHDVLSGRGGGINAHQGNKVFRDWVAERKEDYNLAPNKHEKARVAMEVMDRVRQQNPPGRFLQRDTTSMTGPAWWVEVDEGRALAKTSQALREGAPQIRLAHKEELIERASKPKRSTGKRKRKTTVAPTNSREDHQQKKQEEEQQQQQLAPQAPPEPSLRPLMRRMPTDDYNRAMENLQANVREAKDLAEQHERFQQQENEQDVSKQQYFDPNTKRLRLSEDAFVNTPHVSPGNSHQNVQLLDGFSETPPLLPVPTTPSSDGMEPLDLSLPRKPRDAFYQVMNSAPATKSVPRVHSLAMSDNSMSDTNVMDEDGNFVNPFEDESGIAYKVLRGRQSRDGASNLSSGILRNLSSNEDSNHESCPVEEHHEKHIWEEQRQSFPDLIEDENDHIFHGSWETDFGEGMKSILDVVHPDLTSPPKGEKLPTLLMPWQGDSVSSGILSSRNHNTDNHIISRRRSFTSHSPEGMQERQ